MGKQKIGKEGLDSGLLQSLSPGPQDFTCSFPKGLESSRASGATGEMAGSLS